MRWDGKEAAGRWYGHCRKRVEAVRAGMVGMVGMVVGGWSSIQKRRWGSWQESGLDGGSKMAAQERQGQEMKEYCVSSPGDVKCRCWVEEKGARQDGWAGEEQ
jgi:hypothetical protein